MKNYLLTVFAVLFFWNANAQDDFFTGLEKVVATNVEFTRAGLSQEEGGYASLEGRTGKISIEMTKNSFGKWEGFIGTFTDDNKEYINSQPCPLQVDHYTHPAAYSRDSGFSYFVFVEGVLYKLMYVKNDFQDFDIVEMYVPELSKEAMQPYVKASDKKKTFKDRFLDLAIKFTIAVGGNPFVMEQSKVQHAERIRTYMKQMREIQAANPYSAAIKAEMAVLKEECDKKNAEIKKFNEDYMKSDEYKEIMERNAYFEGKDKEAARSAVTFKNTYNQMVILKSDSGSSIQINPGSTESGSCDENWYIYPLVNNTYTKGALVSSAGSNCQATIEVSY